MPSRPFIMVDIETTGTSPDRSAIIQLAAVRFEPGTRYISHDFFCRSLLIPPTRFWQEDTRSWWAQQRRDVLEGIYAQMEDPREVMVKFAEWVSHSSGDASFISKPLSFDYPFVASYSIEFGHGHMPFRHYLGRDLRSMIEGLVPDFDEKAVPFEGAEHNALFDCLHQIKLLFAALDKAGR